MNNNYVKMTNEKLFETYKEIGYEDDVLNREMARRFAYYMSRHEVPDHDTATDTYRRS